MIHECLCGWQFHVQRSYTLTCPQCGTINAIDAGGDPAGVSYQPLECPHLHQGQCEIASELAGKAVSVPSHVCKLCLTCDRPHRLNFYTLSLAHEANPEVDRAKLQQLIEEGRKDGFGTRLKSMIGRFVQPDGNCSCTGHQDILDAWTAEHIAANLNQVVEWLKNEAEKRQLPFSASLTRLMLKGLLATQNG